MMSKDVFAYLFYKEVLFEHVADYGLFDAINPEDLKVSWVDEDDSLGEVSFPLMGVEISMVVRKEGGHWEIEIGEDYFEDLSRENLFFGCTISLLDTHKKYKDEVEKAMEILDYEEGD